MELTEEQLQRIVIHAFSRGVLHGNCPSSQSGKVIEEAIKEAHAIAHQPICGDCGEQGKDCHCHE